MEPGKQKIQLFNRKCRWSTPTEKNGLWVESGHFPKVPFKIQQDGIQEGLSLVSVGSFFVKATIRTDLQTKRNVHVEVVQFRSGLNSVLDLHEGEYIMQPRVPSSSDVIDLWDCCQSDLVARTVDATVSGVECFTGSRSGSGLTATHNRAETGAVICLPGGEPASHCRL
jgi:hypothetical protein